MFRSHPKNQKACQQHLDRLRNLLKSKIPEYPTFPAFKPSSRPPHAAQLHKHPKQHQQPLLLPVATVPIRRQNKTGLRPHKRLVNGLKQPATLQPNICEVPKRQKLEELRQHHWREC